MIAEFLVFVEIAPETPSAKTKQFNTWPQWPVKFAHILFCNNDHKFACDFEVICAQEFFQSQDKI